MSTTVSIQRAVQGHMRFAELLAEAARRGVAVGEAQLQVASYVDLMRYATREAGPYACTPELARAERALRRRRYLDMDPQQFKSVRRYLAAQEMLTDVERARERQTSLCWKQLSVVEQLWVLLSCLHHHPHRAEDRTRAIINRYFQASNEGLVPVAMASRGVDFFENMLVVEHEDWAELGMHLAGFAEEVLHLMPEDSRLRVTRAILPDFRCTSDCFQHHPTTVSCV